MGAREPMSYGRDYRDGRITVLRVGIDRATARLRGAYISGGIEADEMEAGLDELRRRHAAMADD